MTSQERTVRSHGNDNAREVLLLAVTAMTEGGENNEDESTTNLLAAHTRPLMRG